MTRPETFAAAVRTARPLLAAACLLSFGHTTLYAQLEPVERPPAWSVLRVAKWSTLLLSAGAAIYGFTENERADNLYEELEQLCQAAPAECRARTPDGAYQAPELETRYQRVLDRDRTARTALLASQVGIAASVVLFILDLRNARPPDDIIYEPRPLQVGPARDGGMEVRLQLPAP
ncbi:MAG TPA: hypothetical protein VK939_09985 [Longimicrobiales bacterium]|nr:hypothetical protein [Longimicrobiales bacterium]